MFGCEISMYGLLYLHHLHVCNNGAMLYTRNDLIGSEIWVRENPLDVRARGSDAFVWRDARIVSVGKTRDGVLDGNLMLFYTSIALASLRPDWACRVQT